MKFKYIGKKQQETAFFDKTGIVWTPGAIHDVASLETAKAMLNHPDVFEAVEHAQADPASADSKAGLSDAPGNTEAKREQDSADQGDDPKLLMQTADRVLDLLTLSKDELHALAKERGLSIHPNAKAQTVAVRLAEAFPVAAPNPKGENQ